MAAHPRDTLQTIGLGGAERRVLEALNGGRMHAAWLIAGQRGLGKATLAWRIARFLLANPPRSEGADASPGLFGEAVPEVFRSLDVAEDHPAFAAVMAGAHPDLMCVETAEAGAGGGAARREIGVDEIRALSAFLRHTAFDGGWRVAIIDSADSLNRNAANALLKTLEEPPRHTVILLIAHTLGRVLPTIRSRCRRLDIPPLASGDFQAILAAQGRADLDPRAVERIALLAGDSPGIALALLEKDAVGLADDLIGYLSTPKTEIGYAARMAFLDRAGAAEGPIELFGWVAARLAGFVAQAAVAGETGEGDSGPVGPATGFPVAPLIAQQPAPDRWAACWQRLRALSDRAVAAHLDTRQSLDVMLATLDATRFGQPLPRLSMIDL